MKSYILTNKDKLVRTFAWTSILLTISFLVWTFYSCDAGNCFNGPYLVKGVTVTLIIMPTFIIAFEMILGFIEYRRTDHFFESKPISELLKNGFIKDWTEKESKWILSKLSAVGQFDNYKMICEIEDGRLRIIAKTNYSHLDTWTNNEIESVRQSFRHIKFEYDGDGIATSLKVKDVRKMTYDNLIGHLREFVLMLKKLKVE